MYLRCCDVYNVIKRDDICVCYFSTCGCVREELGVCFVFYWSRTSNSWSGDDEMRGYEEKANVYICRCGKRYFPCRHVDKGMCSSCYKEMVRRGKFNMKVRV